MRSISLDREPPHFVGEPLEAGLGMVQLVARQLGQILRNPSYVRDEVVDDFPQPEISAPFRWSRG